MLQRKTRLARKTPLKRKKPMRRVGIKRKKAKKRKRIKPIRKKANDAFSKLVRLQGRDADGNCTCITCGDKYQWNSGRLGMHAGHFQSRARNATRFDRRNVACQCYRCNVHRNGEQYLFGLWIDKTYGAGTAEALTQLARTTKQFKYGELEEMIEQWEEEIIQLEKAS